MNVKSDPLPRTTCSIPSSCPTKLNARAATLFALAMGLSGFGQFARASERPRLSSEFGGASSPQASTAHRLSAQPPGSPGSGTGAASSTTSGESGSSTDEYSAIDAHALSAPPKVEGDIDNLARYLVSPAKNERQKARAIYRWVTAHVNYDVQGWLTGKIGDTSAPAVLRTRVSVCAGYSALFEALARAAGLQAVTIVGYARGYGYDVASGGGVSGPPNHSWNAVRVDGKWDLVEPTWGAGVPDPQSGAFHQRFEPFFFLTPPEKFLYSHFPVDPRWQLVQAPISRSGFEHQVDARPCFFTCGLDLDSNQGVQIDGTGNLSVRVRAPHNVSLMARVKKDGKPLKGRWTLEQRDGNGVVTLARFPEAGLYTLELFVRRSGDEGPYRLALSYRVNASAGVGEDGYFPLQYGAFLDRQAYLTTPRSGTLVTGLEWFKLRVPGARAVTVSAGGRSTSLVRSEEVFSGAVDLSPGPVTVYAWFEADKGEGLLRYECH